MANNFLKNGLCLLLFCALPLSNHAQESRSYIGVQVDVFQLDLKDRNASSGQVTQRDAMPGALTVKLGGDIREWLAIEGQYTRGIATDEIEDTGVNAELESMAALSAVLKHHVNGPLRIFGKVGVAKAIFKTRASEKGSSQGLLMGAGISLDVSDRSRFVWEYSYLKEGKFAMEGDKFDANTIGFGLVFDI